MHFWKAIFPLCMRTLSTQCGTIIWWNSILESGSNVPLNAQRILSATAVASLEIVKIQVFQFEICVMQSCNGQSCPLHVTQRALWTTHHKFMIPCSAQVNLWRSRTRWEKPAPELLPVCLEQGGNMAPQNQSAKDMHAQLSAWELLVGLPNTGTEQFTVCCL